MGGEEEAVEVAPEGAEWEQGREVGDAQELLGDLEGCGRRELARVQALALPSLGPRARAQLKGRRSMDSCGHAPSSCLYDWLRLPVRPCRAQSVMLRTSISLALICSGEHQSSPAVGPRSWVQGALVSFILVASRKQAIAAL